MLQSRRQVPRTVPSLLALRMYLDGSRPMLIEYAQWLLDLPRACQEMLQLFPHSLVRRAA